MGDKLHGKVVQTATRDPLQGRSTGKQIGINLREYEGLSYASM